MEGYKQKQGTPEEVRGAERQMSPEQKKDSQERLGERISDFIESSGIKKFDSIRIVKLSGETAYLRFHSFKDGAIRGVDSASYYGSANAMREADEERELAIKQDRWNESVGIDFIKEIEIGDNTLKLLE